MPVDIDALIPSMLNQYDSGRLIVGVDGLSRAGKTTIVSEIRKRLIENDKPVHIFHMDDYIVARNRRYHTGFAEWYEYYSLQWDVEYLRRHLFDKLRDGQQFVLPFYNPERDDTVDKKVVLAGDCIVIVEGVFLQREEWRHFFDVVVYLDCPRDVRFSRESASAREKVEKFKTRYWKAEDHYLETVHPLSKADMVINS